MDPFFNYNLHKNSSNKPAQINQNIGRNNSNQVTAQAKKLAKKAKQKMRREKKMMVQMNMIKPLMDVARPRTEASPAKPTTQMSSIGSQNPAGLGVATPKPFHSRQGSSLGAQASVSFKNETTTIDNFNELTRKRNLVAHFIFLEPADLEFRFIIRYSMFGAMTLARPEPYA